MKVEWAPAGLAHLARIFSFNCERSQSWAERVDERLRDRAEALRATPFIGRPIGPTGMRALSVPDIQYVIVYRIDAEQVTILRVHSTREAQ